ncbi:MAG: cell division protein ZapD [Pseudomonadota bacterium]
MTGPVYEHPLNERTRIFLRIETLFACLDGHLADASMWSAKAALSVINELVDLFARPDLKGEFTVELDRLIRWLQALAQSPDVDRERLQHYARELQEEQERLYQIHGQLGQDLRQHELLAAVRGRQAIAGGVTHFELPALHYWMNLHETQRLQNLQDWAARFYRVRPALELILQLLRECGAMQWQTARQGIYQQALNPRMPPALIRVRLDSPEYFPVISGGPHRFTISFSELVDLGRSRLVNSDVDFELGICSL